MQCSYKEFQWYSRNKCLEIKIHRAFCCWIRALYAFLVTVYASSKSQLNKFNVIFQFYLNFQWCSRNLSSVMLTDIIVRCCICFLLNYTSSAASVISSLSWYRTIRTTTLGRMFIQIAFVTYTVASTTLHTANNTLHSHLTVTMRARRMTPDEHRNEML